MNTPIIRLRGVRALYQTSEALYHTTDVPLVARYRTLYGGIISDISTLPYVDV